MDTDGNEVTGYKKFFPPDWDGEVGYLGIMYNNGNLAVLGIRDNRFVFGRLDLEGDIYEDFDYISDEVIYWPYSDEFRFINHNNGFVCIAWADDCDLWYQYTLDGFAVDEPHLEASSDGDGILLSWREEEDLVGSNWRLERDGEHLVNLSGDAIYRYLDRDAEPNVTHLYTLEATLPDGTVRTFGPVEAAWPGLDAGRFTLYTPYPCPAADRVILSYYLPEGTKNVELSLYDLSGRLLESSVSLPTAPGRHEISYDASNLPPGVYVARLSTSTASLSQRIVITR
ncbi:MAG TPA: T9SS type A sorting domain-containing protein [bacterium]|nr:T9SS type A sorting domain-containing protein [bacterium]